MTLNDFSAEFEIAVISKLPKNWTADLTDTQFLGHEIVKYERAKNSIAVQQNGKKAGHVGWAVRQYVKDVSKPLGQRIVKSTWIYVDKGGKPLK